MNLTSESQNLEAQILKLFCNQLEICYFMAKASLEFIYGGLYSWNLKSITY